MPFLYERGRYAAFTCARAVFVHLVLVAKQLCSALFILRGSTLYDFTCTVWYETTHVLL